MTDAVKSVGRKRFLFFVYLLQTLAVRNQQESC